MNYLTYKKIILIFSIVCFVNNTLYSQDEDNNWVVGVGINAVDIRTPEAITEVIKDYANASIEDLNMYGSPIRFFIGKYINNGFTLQVSGSLNTVKKGFGYTGFEEALINDSFFVMDAKVKYDVNRLVGETSWFDPFILTGVGYSKIGEKSNTNIGVGWGFNAWISDTVGINVQSDYNHHLKSTATDYFQHSLGVVFKLDINARFNWRDGR